MCQLVMGAPRATLHLVDYMSVLADETEWGVRRDLTVPRLPAERPHFWLALKKASE